jgi:hypothetical protein
MPATFVAQARCKQSRHNYRLGDGIDKRGVEYRLQSDFTIFVMRAISERSYTEKATVGAHEM